VELVEVAQAVLVAPQSKKVVFKLTACLPFPLIVSNSLVKKIVNRIVKVNKNYFVPTFLCFCVHIRHPLN
jgi:hypothetical protein